MLSPESLTALMVGLLIIIGGPLMVLATVRWSRAWRSDQQRALHHAVDTLADRFHASLRQAAEETVRALRLQQDAVRESHDAVQALQEQVHRAQQEIGSLRDDLTRMSDDVAALSPYLRVLHDQVIDDHAQQRDITIERIRRTHQQQFQQIEALASLYYALRPRHPIPATRVWAASPDLLWHLYRTVRESGVRQVLECGSGVSTLILAYALQEQGEGRVYALEHDEAYARSTRDLLRQHQLQARAEVLHAPLRPVDLNGDTWLWYDTTAIPQQSFDLIFVDGPPGATRDHARFPAVPLLRDRLADDGIIVLDDHSRPDEADIGRRWLDHYPELAAETLPHEKGTLVLRRTPHIAG